MAFTPEQDAALLAQMRRADAEFAEWSAAVQARTIRLEGAEREASRAGWRAGRVRASDAEQAETTAGYTARQRVAFAAGYGEGRAMPAVPPDFKFPSAADLLNRARR